MATPGWVRRRRQQRAAEDTVARTELHLQALERNEKDEAEAAKHWTPRRGMSFASEGET